MSRKGNPVWLFYKQVPNAAAHSNGQHGHKADTMYIKCNFYRWAGHIANLAMASSLISVAIRPPSHTPPTNSRAVDAKEGKSGWWKAKRSMRTWWRARNTVGRGGMTGILAPGKVPPYDRLHWSPLVPLGETSNTPLHRYSE
ncbi:hypothetical protein BT69DRAFT_1294201 [Atractiella rhizophila]|nr:hypothetical protein BT69DRAFT_1294201 [Atractiella rhizophila]